MASSIRRPAREVGVGGGVPEWVREEGRRFLEVLALTGFALAQPVLDPLGRSPETFIAHHVGARGIVTFAVAVAVLPPILVSLLAATFRRFGARARRGAHVAVVGVLAAFTVLQFLAHVTTWSRRFVLLLAAVSGVAAAVARSRRRWLRAWLRYASPAPLVFVAVFLFASPVSTLVTSARAGAGVEDAARTSVVLVVFDEFALTTILDGNGGIDRELFPNLAAFADDATWYRNATTVSPLTLGSIPSILTGRIPSDPDRAPTYSSYPDNLFTMLQDSHIVNGHEWITELCPPRVCGGQVRDSGVTTALARLALDVWWDATWPTDAPPPPDLAAELLLTGASRQERFQAFLDAMGRYDRPSLDVLHIALPHFDWDLLPSGQEYWGPKPKVSMRDPRLASDDRADFFEMRYLLQAQRTDALVGSLVARLEELGRLDDSMVILAADHGVVFGGGQSYRELGDDSQVDVGWVPLLVKAPGQHEGVVSDANVLLVDVLPTIAEELGVAVPWDLDGVPAGARLGTAKPVASGRFTSLANEVGGRGQLDPSAFEEVLAAGPAGSGSGPLRVWRSGRLGDLVGRRVADLPTGPPAEVDISLSVPESLADFDPSADRLDLFVAGTIDPPGGFDVALAVDGVVAGWSETWVATERPEVFGVLLAAPLLHEGHHEIDAYVVDQEGAELVLRPAPEVDAGG